MTASMLLNTLVAIMAGGLLICIILFIRRKIK